VLTPDVIIVVDPTLIGSDDLLIGVTGETTFIVNTEKSAGDIMPRLGLDDHPLVTVPANIISQKLFGRPIPNSALMGAFSRAFPSIIVLDDLLREARHVFAHLLAADVVEKNLEAIQRGHDEARTA